MLSLVILLVSILVVANILFRCSGDTIFLNCCSFSDVHTMGHGLYINVIDLKRGRHEESLQVDKNLV